MKPGSSPVFKIPFEFFPMNIIHIGRTLKTDPVHRTSSFETTLKFCGIPVIRSRRTNYKIVSILGIPVLKKKLHSQTKWEQLSHQLTIATDVQHIPGAQGIMRVMQLSALQLLKKIDEVCKKHGLTYWLDYGTLLGAVRHQGFIPWDDDIDISMLREDWEKMRELLDDEFGTGNFSYNMMGFIQIHYKDTTMQVDIFPFDRAPESWFPEGEKESGFIDKVYAASAQVQFDIDLTQDQKESIVSHSYQELRNLHRELIMSDRPLHQTGNVFLGMEVSSSTRYTLKHEWIFPLQMLDFEGIAFPCPRLPEMFFYTHYGDWGKLPANPCFHFNRSALNKSSFFTMLEISRNGLPENHH